MSQTPCGLLELARAVQSTPGTIVAWDVDSTLFCVSPRSQAIIREFAKLPHVKKEYSEMIPVLESVTVRSSDWGIREALMRTGVDVSSEFVQAIRAFWREHFFSDAFLEHDQIFDGAADYVKLLEILGAQILYVTGRYHHSMRQGTLTQLQKFGFPLKSESQLIMKSGNSADEQFKANQLLELSKMQRPIWLVDNEPVILIEVERSTPHVHFVHMRTTHSGRSHPNPNWRSATPEDYLKITALFKDSSR